MEQFSNCTAKTIIVLGSGGHTAEMVEIIKTMDKSKYTPRYYIVAKTDKISREKILKIEDDISAYTFVEMIRSRNVKQSYFSSIFTTFLAILTSIPLVWKIQPDLVLCNGPSTCVPICLITYFFKLIRFLPKCKIVFVESFCRVKSISLSGKICRKFADLFVVQWPELADTKRKLNYYGRLI